MDDLAPCASCGTSSDDCADLNANDSDACCSGCRHLLVGGPDRRAGPMSRCLAETCANWTGHGCACTVMDVEPACVPCLMGDTCHDHDPTEDGGQDR